MMHMFNMSTTNDTYVQHEHNVWYTGGLTYCMLLHLTNGATELQLMVTILPLSVSSHAIRSNYMRYSIRSIFVHTNGILS